MISETRRVNRIFHADGRALIVALDHGQLDGPCPGLESPAETIANIVAGGADAVLTSYGIVATRGVLIGRVADVLITDHITAQRLLHGGIGQVPSLSVRHLSTYIQSPDELPPLQ